jgi:hypothetical protein
MLRRKTLSALHHSKRTVCAAGCAISLLAGPGTEPNSASRQGEDKAVLPITLDEVYTDQEDRGRLDRASRERLYACLKRWLPLRG